MPKSLLDAIPVSLVADGENDHVCLIVDLDGVESRVGQNFLAHLLEWDAGVVQLHPAAFAFVSLHGHLVKVVFTGFPVGAGVPAGTVAGFVKTGAKLGTLGVPSNSDRGDCFWFCGDASSGYRQQDGKEIGTVFLHVS